MRVHLGPDHAALELKGHLLRHLVEQDHDVHDVGPADDDEDDDYSPYCIQTGRVEIASLSRQDDVAQIVAVGARCTRQTGPRRP